MWTIHERKTFRTAHDVICSSASPFSGLCPDVQRDARHAAVIEVLCCIPPAEFRRSEEACVGARDDDAEDGEEDGAVIVENKEEKAPISCQARGEKETKRSLAETRADLQKRISRLPVLWFIPDRRVDGWVQPYLKAATVLYLSPCLENKAWSVVVGTVAHEIAHIVLRHSPMPGGVERYEAQETAAWQRARDWGFEKETKKCLAVNKRRDSFEKTQIRKLIVKQRSETE